MNGEGCAYIDLAGDGDRSSHLFNDFLANTETQPSAYLVDLFVLFEFGEVNEELVQVFLLYTHSGISDIYPELDEPFLLVLSLAFWISAADFKL